MDSKKPIYYLYFFKKKEPTENGGKKHHKNKTEEIKDITDIHNKSNELKTIKEYSARDATISTDFSVL